MTSRHASSNPRARMSLIQIAVRSALVAGAALPFARAYAVGPSPAGASAAPQEDTASQQSTPAGQGTVTQQGTANQPNPNAPTEELQEVVVTGVRAAIDRALQFKENADSIVDSISMEDIGQLPDSNVAEALQRVPGVAIDRSGGEGRYVSINGLGPDFSLTLLNGRQIASSDDTRSFSYDQLASNLVSQVNVYKTANADTPEGGLGGVVDVRTVRPFDFSGFKGSASISEERDESSGSTDPQASFLISDRFDDGRLGLLASFTHQKYVNREKLVTTSGGWSQNYFVNPVTEAYMADARLPDAWRPWNLYYGEDISTRTRDGGTAVVQFQATDTLTLTADYLNSKFTDDETTYQGGAYLWAVLCAQNLPYGTPCPQGSGSTAANSQGYYHTLDVSAGNNPVTGLPNMLGSFAWQGTTFHRPTDTQMAGFNAEWNPSDKFRAVFDFYWSGARNDDRGDDESQTREMAQGNSQPEYLALFPDVGVPQFNLLGNNLAAKESLLGVSNVYNTGSYVDANNRGAQADFDYMPRESTHIKFGASFTNEAKSDLDYSTPTPVSEFYHLATQFYNGALPGVPASAISGVLYAGSQFGVTSPTPFPVFLFNDTALRAWLTNPATANGIAAAAGCTSASTTPVCTDYAAFAANGYGYTAQLNGSSFSVDEKDSDAYGEISQNFNLGAVPVNVVAGLRYTRTALVSSGASEIITGYTLYQQGGQLLFPVYAGGTPPKALPVSVSHSYGNFLPSLNLKFKLLPDLIYRVGVSRTVTRPTLTDLSPVMSGFGGNTLPNGRDATAENPNLAPFVSTNYDMALEWYYSKHDVIALEGFYKDAKDFIIKLTQPQQITTISSVPPGVNLSLAQLQTTQVNAPYNAADAKVSGATIAWTHDLPLGFGFQLNYTKVSSSARVDLPASIIKAQQLTFSMPGVSDTANAIGFWEWGRYSVRVAYNWRSAFLINPNDPPLTLSEYEDAYHQIDARIGVKVFDGFQLSLSGVNVTDSKVRWYSGVKSNFDSLYDYGSQYTLTLSKDF